MHTNDECLEEKTTFQKHFWEESQNISGGQPFDNKKRDADHYAIWLEHARKLETFVRNLQIQLRIIIIKTFHLEFNSTSSLVSSSGFQFWELNSIRQKRTQKCFYSLSILTATWSTVNITFACHQLVSPSASLDSCISFKNADRLLADFFLVVLFGNLFGTFSISSNVVIIPDYSDFFYFRISIF